MDFATCKNMIDFCNIFLVHVQAERIFKAVDVKADGKIGLSEFENFLMAYDCLEQVAWTALELSMFMSVVICFQFHYQASSDILLLDTYDSLKMIPDTKTFGEFGRFSGLDYSGFCEAIQVLGIRSKEEKDIVEAFCAAAKITQPQLSSTFLTLQQFKKAFLKMADLEVCCFHTKHLC